MWAPELYIDPAFQNRVTLSFTAKVWDDPLTDYSTPWGAGHTGGQPTCFTTNVLLSEFVKEYTDPSKIYFGDTTNAPVVTYVYNDANISWWDGGAHLSPFQVVPVSGYRFYTEPTQNPGTAYFSPGGFYSHRGVDDPRSWIGIDSFVYFETDYRPWFFYTYFSPQGSSVANYPMINTVTNGQWWYRERCLDQTFPGGLPRPGVLGYPTNSYNRLDAVDGYSAGTINNGGGVCEGVSVFRRPAAGMNYTYILFSRNDTFGPSYGIFYSKVAGNVWNLPSIGGDPAERPLVMSARRLLPGGVSFGHGEVFQFLGRYYLIFHVKETGPAYPYPLTRYGRTVYIKELTFDGSGNISPLSCDQTDPALDVNVFLAPYIPSSSTVSGTIDPNGN
jgi:hypothetical protein